MPNNHSNKAELWKSRVDECLSSNLTAKEWCRQQELPYSTLCYWIKKLCSSSINTEPVFAEITANNFSFNDGSPVTIRFAGVSIDIAEHCHPELLSNLIGILKHYA